MLRLLLFLAVVRVAVPAHALGQADAQVLPEALIQKAPVLRFERLGLEDGMAQLTVQSVVQDSLGFLWIGTQSGLNRYDGYEFKVYTSVPFDTTSLSDSHVYNVAPARGGQLWVATHRGLNRFDPATGRAVHYKYDPSDSTSLANDVVTDVLAASNGDVWVVAGRTSLQRMRAGTDGRFEEYRLDPHDAATGSGDYLGSLHEDAEGRIWVGSANGVKRLDPETGIVTRYLADLDELTAAGLPTGAQAPHIPSGNPEIAWVPTSNGMVRLHLETGAYDRFLVEPNRDGYNSRNRLYAVVADPADPHVLWAVGSSSGLVRFDTRTTKYTTYKNDERDPHSLSSDFATAILADRSGTMWVGTGDRGLNVFNPKSVDFVHLRHEPNDPESLAPGAVYALFIDRSGSLWIGTQENLDDSHLTQIDARTGRATRHRSHPSNPSSLHPGSVQAIAEDAAGYLWIGHSQGAGISQLQAATGRVRRLTYEPIRGAAISNHISAVLPSKADPHTFWLGTYAGVFRLDTRTSGLELIAPGEIEGDGVWSLYEDGAGTLWAGTNDGLYRIDQGNVRLAAFYDAADTTSISGNLILHIAERASEPGILWLATGNGLNRYDTRTGIATHFQEEDGIANNVVYGILEDDQGTLWLSTNNGISNVDPETRSIRNYGLDDGLMALEYNQNAFAKGPGGMLYFGSVEGVTAFSPADLSTNTIPPAVTLTDIKLFNRSVPVGPDSPLQQSLSETKQITLAHDQNEITLEFVALHFGNPKKNRYAYQLVGHDPEWIDAASRRSATYANLAPGTYTFRVIAANADGVWNEEGTSIGLRITPPWWLNWWAYLGFAALLSGIVVSGSRLQRSRLAKSEAERVRVREIELRAEAQQRRREDAERLSEIGKAITSTLSIPEVIDTVYEHVNALMDATVFGIGIYNASRERLDFPLMKERGAKLPPFTHELSDDSRPSVWCFKRQEAFVVGDFDSEYQRYLPNRKDPAQGGRMRSIIYLPLVHQEKAVGVITTQSAERDAYTDYDVSVLRTLATYAAIALDNAQSYRRLDATLNELRATQEQLVQQEKLASLGALTAGIAHEIKNPLNFVNNFSSLSVELVDELQDAFHSGRQEEAEVILGDLRLNAQKIEEHGRRADSIVRSMMAHARGGEGIRQPIALNAFIQEYADLAYHGQRARFPEFSAEVIHDLDAEVGQVEIVPQEIGRVLLNLLSNAFDAISVDASASAQSDNGSGRSAPTVRVVTQRTVDHVAIRVEDNGPGISESVRARIFEPFFTTKPTGLGTGLGLSLSHDIITKGHGGTLSVESVMGHGTTFTITLPVDRVATDTTTDTTVARIVS